MHNLHQSKKIKVWRRDGFQCTYCGRKSSNTLTITVDHILPKAKGGNNNYENLTTCCNPCNSKKGSLLLIEFLKRENIQVTDKISQLEEYCG
jgi:5-methylcytosine-specific restriction endonuclease McrA